MVETISPNLMIKNEKEKMYQFIPKKFEFLTKTKKIKFKKINLKTDILINICNELIIKYFCTDDIKFNLWSILLKKKYGKYYNYYFDYLLEKEFIFRISNYYVGKKARTYKINFKMLEDIIRCFITDKILLKKYSENYLNQSFLYINKSPIELEIREKLVEDLKYVEIDYDKALKFINENIKHDKFKYIKNLNAIDSIKTKHLYFKFDSYGRMHTNFTNLKKEIRNNFLKIDNSPIYEIDLKNSQPLFFTKILENEIGEENFDLNCKRFVSLVKNGLIYDELIDKIDFIKNKEQSKISMYKILFGTNNLRNKENKEFKKLFPSVFEYLIELKSIEDSYKELSHTLQKLESDFIFGNIVKTIKNKYPNIKLITVHDSIIFPFKYKNEVELIFNQLKNEKFHKIKK
jgi:hypothetical protein